MSEYRTVFRPEPKAELRKIPRDMALRILARLTELESDPLGFNTTALVSQPERRRLRVGD
ncbi:mRNA interferase RelE/StbE [Streptomyces sp. KS 21]|nr:mRNA interferase RelE/StbE [Streptomyces sp. KS 21]